MEPTQLTHQMTVTTGGSPSTYVLKGSSTMSLGPHSGGNIAPSESGVSVSLNYGEASFQLAKDDLRMVTVGTPQSLLHAAHGTFKVLIDGDQTAVSVCDGEVEAFTSLGKEVDGDTGLPKSGNYVVKAGQQAMIGNKGKIFVEEDSSLCGG